MSDEPQVHPPDDHPEAPPDGSGPLSIGQVVTLNWASEASAGSAHATVANLLRSRAWLDLARPDAAVASLAPGQEIRVGFQRAPDSYCAADVRFIELVRERPMRIAVERPTHAYPVQRRAFFRLRIRVPLTIVEHEPRKSGGSQESGPLPPALADQHAGKLETTEPPAWSVSGETEDLSAGGLRFVTRVDLRVDDRVDVNLGFPPGSWLEIGAEVVRVEPLWGQSAEPPSPDAARGIALAFVRISERDQDRIVAQLFEYQRRARHRR